MKKRLERVNEENDIRKSEEKKEKGENDIEKRKK